MKTILALSLLMISTSPLADRPDCSLTPGDCRGGVPSDRSNAGGNFAAIPEPGTLALIGMGVAGLVVARRRKR